MFYKWLKKLIVSVILEDFEKNGPITQALRNCEPLHYAGESGEEVVFPLSIGADGARGVLFKTEGGKSR